MLVKKFKNTFLVLGAALSLSIPFAFSGDDNYFEISKNLDIFATLFKEVNTYYVDAIDPAKLMKTGIDAMLESLDPYTNFISESDIEGYRFMTTGKYGGIGATIRMSGDYVAVAEPYEGYPAMKNGLRAGDLILEVDGKSVKGKNTEDVSKVLKGTPGTDVKVLIRRPGSDKDLAFSLKREEVKISSVPYYGMLKNDVAYIRLTQFTEHVGKDVADALDDLKKNNAVKGIILDLRGNPGGLLNEAVNIANVFIDKGEKIVTTKGKLSTGDKDYFALNSAIDTKTPLVILANSGSASASEIVSGTIQDVDRGVVVGQRTFGKGLVQTTRPLSYNTQLKVTTAHYYTPSGRCIQALDYAHRNEDGSVGKIADSLKTAFKTKSGRTVYDGGGVDPDYAIDARKYGNITIALLTKNLLFDWATEYRLKNESISDAKTFRLTDAEYNEFCAWLKDKDYSYSTKTEEELKKLKDQAEKEKYLDAIQLDYSNIEQKLKADKQNDLIKYKDEIKNILEDEIVSRYYYQKGRIQNSLEKDPEISKGIEILGNIADYTKTLQPK